jgi:voltage-gated potassium channel
MTSKMIFKRNHHIIIGVHHIAPHIIRELHQTKTPFCVICQNPEIATQLVTQYQGIIVFEHREKHLTDAIFEKVQIQRAASVTLDLGSDETNHIVADLVREKNPQVRILSVGEDITYAPIMSKRINSVVNPHFMCAMRLASLAKRPGVVTHLDRMLYKKDGVYRIEEIAVKTGSQFIGKSLGDLDLPHRYRLVVTEIISVRSDGGTDSNYLPLPENIIQDNMTLIVQGRLEDIEAFRDVADPMVEDAH